MKQEATWVFAESGAAYSKVKIYINNHIPKL
jgi:hypothetical protein